MIVDVTIKHIQVLGNPKSINLLIHCKTETGKEFEFQLSESLSFLKGKNLKAIKEHLLKRVGKLIKENIESETEVDENGKWKLDKDFRGKVFRLDTSLIQ